MAIEEGRAYTSRVISDLDAAILHCKSNEDRNVLFARKAFSLARHSHIPGARDLIRSLRAVNQTFEPRLSAWIMFAEGITEYCETMDTRKAKDRILRSHLIGQVANDPTLAATSAAWLGFFCFMQSNYSDAKDYLLKAFSWSKSQDAEARSRACLVLGIGYIFAGDSAKGKHWMNVARQHAIDSGDIAMQNIIFYNSSTYSAAQLTLLDCIADVDAPTLNFALMSAQSSSNLNRAIGIANQPSMLAALRAELLTIAQQWQGAIELFDRSFETLSEDGQMEWKPKFFAQRAWCKANVGDVQGCNKDREVATRDMALCVDPDDQYILHFRLSQISRALGDDHAAEVERGIAEQYLQKYRVQQAVVLNYFDEVVKAIHQ